MLASLLLLLSQSRKLLLTHTLKTGLLSANAELLLRSQKILLCLLSLLGSLLYSLLCVLYTLLHLLLLRVLLLPKSLSIPKQRLGVHVRREHLRPRNASVWIDRNQPKVFSRYRILVGPAQEPQTIRGDELIN